MLGLGWWACLLGPRTGPSKGAVLRRHGDQVQRMAYGGYCAQGRCDDTMNLGGIKVGRILALASAPCRCLRCLVYVAMACAVSQVSSVEIERACMAIGLPGVQEVAAVASSSPGGGPERLVVFCVLSKECPATPQDLKAEFSIALKTHLNPLFKVSACFR